MLTAIKILVSGLTLFYGFAPMAADLNATHIFNPVWSSHARFHGIWYLLFAAGVALTSLYLIWWRGEIVVPVITGLLFMAGFWAATFFAPWYDGAVTDDNIVATNIAGLEANSFLFSVATLLLIVSLVLVFIVKQSSETGKKD